MASGGMDSTIGEGGFLTLAATVLCCYEHAITFSEEFRCIWRRPISVAKVLFVLNRYSMLAASLVSIVQVFPFTYYDWLGGDYSGTMFDEVCSVSVRFVDACLIVVNLTYCVFAALRMYALYGLSKHMFVCVFFVGVLNPLAQIFLMLGEGASTYSVSLPLGAESVGRMNCGHYEYRWLLSAWTHTIDLMTCILCALRLHALCFEGMLIALTWKKTFSRWNLQTAVMRTPFTTVLLRDGTLYFVAIAVATTLNSITMMLYIFSSDVLAISIWVLSLTGPLVDALTSICMSRFILGLLSISLDEGSSQLRTSQWKTLHFATIAETFAGDVAAIGDEPMGGHLDVDDLVGEPTDALEAGAASGGVVDIEA